MTGRQHAALGVAVAAPIGAAVATGAVIDQIGSPAEWIAVGQLPANGASLPTTIIVLAIIGGLLGALVPDLDTNHSLLEAAPMAALRHLRPQPLLWLLAAPGLLALSLVLSAVNWLIMMVTAHRGLTHSLLGLVAATGGVWLLTAWAVGPALAIGLGAGYISHLGADMLTPQGVRLAVPLTHGSWHLLPRSLRFGGASRRAGCLTVFALVSGLALAAWLVWRVLPAH